jgi:peroxiredoxin
MKAWVLGLCSVVMMVGPAAVSAEVEVGKPAPAFSAKDAAGATRSLDEFKGKFVVLEWFNPECPFVKKHYGTKNMQTLQQQYTGKGVAWLSINSSAENKQGHVTGEQATAWAKEQGAAPTAILLDTDGTVGKLYHAATTPHVFVIDDKGVVIYHGAIDDVPSTDPADVKGAHNYVAQTLDEAMAGKPVTATPTQPYGCSVKY